MVPMAPSSTRMRSAARRRSVSSVRDMAIDMSTGSGALPLPEGERGGVRGYGSMMIDSVQNFFEHTVHITHHVVIPESKHEVTHRLQDSGSIRITFSVVIVLTTVKLHDQFGIRTEEIDDKTIDRRLPLELPSGQTAITQSQPQQSLCIRLLAAQSSSGVGVRSLHPTPLPPALSRTGRGSAPCSWLAPWAGRRPSRGHTA